MCRGGKRNATTSLSKSYLNSYFLYNLMSTITISKEEYDYLKRLEQAAEDGLLHSIKRGLEDAAKGRIRER